MAKFSKRGQVATEYMLLIGFLLAIVGVASAYALFFYIESFKVSEARNTVTLLAETADQVYAWGPGNAREQCGKIQIGTPLHPGDERRTARESAAQSTEGATQQLRGTAFDDGPGQRRRDGRKLL